MRASQFTVSLTCLLFLGCSSGPSIQGTWESTSSRPVSITFGKQNDLTWTVSAMGQSADITATYTRDKNRITIINPKLPATLETLKAISGNTQAVPNKIDAIVSFKTEDEIVLTGHTLLDGTYKRKTTN